MDENPYHFAVVGEEDPDFAVKLCICTEVYSRYEAECASGREQKR